MRQRLTASILFALLTLLSTAALAKGPAPLPKSTPWKLDELFQAPKFEWHADKGTVRSLFYVSEPYKGKPTRVFAYYASPRTLDEKAEAKKFPGVVLIHGGGGTAFREWAELWAKRGYAAIAMDTAGHQPNEGQNAHDPRNRTRLSDGGPHQTDAEKFGAIDQPVTEQWEYHAVAAAVRAHSLLLSFPEVDAEKTAVTGISWGGYLTSIVSGVDSRFKAAVPVYGCGYLWENSAWLTQFGRMKPESKQRWIELWDPSRYLPSVSMPILFVNGTNDFAYPLDSYMKSVDAVLGEKQIRVTVNMPHGHPQGWAPVEIGLFIDHHLLGTPGLAVLETPQLSDSAVRTEYKSDVKLKSAALHFTPSVDAINKRSWKTVPGAIESGTIVTPAPPADATVWFITATDERDATVSSRVMIIK